jgi:hypothetical protein
MTALCQQHFFSIKYLVAISKICNTPFFDLMLDTSD